MFLHMHKQYLYKALSPPQGSTNQANSGGCHSSHSVIKTVRLTCDHVNLYQANSGGCHSSHSVIKTTNFCHSDSSFERECCPHKGYLPSSVSSLIAMVVLSCSSGTVTTESNDVSITLNFSTGTSRTLPSSTIDMDIHCISAVPCPEVKIISAETTGM